MLHTHPFLRSEMTAPCFFLPRFGFFFLFFLKKETCISTPNISKYVSNIAAACIYQYCASPNGLYPEQIKPKPMRRTRTSPPRPNQSHSHRVSPTQGASHAAEVPAHTHLHIKRQERYLVRSRQTQLVTQKTILPPKKETKLTCQLLNEARNEQVCFLLSELITEKCRCLQADEDNEKKKKKCQISTQAFTPPPPWCEEVPSRVRICKQPSRYVASRTDERSLNERLVGC